MPNCRERETANRRCDNCRYCALSLDFIHDAVSCECRARPPRFCDRGTDRAFPPVERHWWCARFVARPSGDDGGLAKILDLAERRKADAEERNRQREADWQAYRKEIEGGTK